jgi:hypothetical protein
MAPEGEYKSPLFLAGFFLPAAISARRTGIATIRRLAVGADPATHWTHWTHRLASPIIGVAP